MKVKDLEQQKQRLVEQVSDNFYLFDKNSPLFSSKATKLVFHKTVTKRDFQWWSLFSRANCTLCIGYMSPAFGTSTVFL